MKKKYETRSCSKVIRFSPKEIRSIKEKAGKLNMSDSEFIRECIKQHTTNVIFEDKEIADRLYNIQNCLSRINVITAQDKSKVEKEISSIEDKIMGKLDKGSEM